VVSGAVDITPEIQADIAVRCRGTMRAGLVTIMLAAMLSLPAGAKDLGTLGHLFPVTEPDLLAFIGQRLEGMKESGGWTGYSGMPKRG
jgi:hypothetical protein